MDYKKIIQNAIDLHVHIGPEIIPRKFTLSQLLEYEKGKLKGVGVKNHFFPTIPAGSGHDLDGYPLVIHSVVLNRYSGGFNSEIVRASAELSKKPIIVWFPTLHTKKFIDSQELEIPKEWIDPKLAEQIRLRPASAIIPLAILDDSGLIKKEVQEVLRTIKEFDAILATGHLSWEESVALVQFAKEAVGIEKIIITHPIYQKISMPIDVQKKLIQMGALIEHCYSMHTIDKIPIADIATQIKQVGSENCILSSDVGQIFSKSPSEALTDFIELLEQEGLAEDEIKSMLIDNPSRLIEVLS